MSDKSQSLELATPIEFGQELVTSLDFRDAVGADLEDFPIGSVTMGDYLRLASRLTDQPLSVLRKASGPDTIAIVARVDRQLAFGPPTGET